MKRTIEHIDGKRWASIDIEINDGRLSICGHYGDILSPKEARNDAREYWESFFEDQPGEIIEMNKRMNTRFHSAASAAKYVIQTDGEYHGLDVHRITEVGVFTTSGCGQCIDTIYEEFPKFPNIKRIKALWDKWHLNDMHAGTEEQERLLDQLKHTYDTKKFKSHYDWACSVLKENNLLDVPTGREVMTSMGSYVPETYTYGSAWLKRDLPSDIEYIINSL